MHFVNLLSFYNKILNRSEIKLKRIRLISRPVELTLEPTLKCNSNCIMCNRNFNRKEAKNAEGFLSWDILWKVKPFFKYAERVGFSGFGEPLLHPEYLAMLREIKKAGSFVYFFTNGTLMTEEIGKELVEAGIDMICVSIGGASRDTYKKIRGIDAFKTVVDNIKRISEYKRKIKRKKPLLSFNVVAMNSLLPELEALLDLAHELGVEHIAFPNLVVQGESMNKESIWHNKEKAGKTFKKAGDLARELGITFIAPRLDICKIDCREFFKSLYITWDGKVLSCALERYIIGDLNKSTIASIWNGKGITKLRKDYYKKGLEGTCPNCPCWDNRPETFLSPWINSREYAKKIFK